MGQNLLKCLENGPALRSLMYGATFGMAPSDARESNFGGRGGIDSLSGVILDPSPLSDNCRTLLGCGVVTSSM
jgi:hypothetical protein